MRTYGDSDTCSTLGSHSSRVTGSYHMAHGESTDNKQVINGLTGRVCGDTNTETHY